MYARHGLLTHGLLTLSAIAAQLSHLCGRKSDRRILTLTLGLPQRRTGAQKFQFWRRLANQVTNYLVVGL
jgi:hypothetical protein